MGTTTPWRARRVSGSTAANGVHSSPFCDIAVSSSGQPAGRRGRAACRALPAAGPVSEPVTDRHVRPPSPHSIRAPFDRARARPTVLQQDRDDASAYQSTRSRARNPTPGDSSHRGRFRVASGRANRPVPFAKYRCCVGSASTSARQRGRALEADTRQRWTTCPRRSGRKNHVPARTRRSRVASGRCLCIALPPRVWGRLPLARWARDIVGWPMLRSGDWPPRDGNRRENDGTGRRRRGLRPGSRRCGYPNASTSKCHPGRPTSARRWFTRPFRTASWQPALIVVRDTTGCRATPVTHRRNRGKAVSYRHPAGLRTSRLQRFPRSTS